jgi:uncharacterized integral membrane protein
MENAIKKNMFWIMAGLIIILATVFAIQNYDNVEVTIFFLKLNGPLFFVIVVVFGLGVLLGRIWGALAQIRKNKVTNGNPKIENAKVIED